MLTEFVCMWLQALPFYNAETQDLRMQLEDAIQDAVACMPVRTADQMLDLNVGQNPTEFAERLAAAQYGHYSSTGMEQKQCLDEHG